MGPAGSEWEVARDSPGWAPELAWLPSVDGTVSTSQALLELLPGQQGLPPAVVQAFLGAENRNQPCVFQAARLLRNSGLSPSMGTPFFCPPLTPFRKGLPTPSRLASCCDEGEGSGDGLLPLRQLPLFGHWPLPSPVPQLFDARARVQGLSPRRLLGT